MLRRLVVVAGLVGALVLGLSSVSEASTSGPPTGCTLTATQGYLQPAVTYFGPPGGHLVQAYAPKLSCTPYGTYAVRTTWMLQRYYFTGALWKTEWTGTVRNYAGYALATQLPCVTSGALMRLTVQFKLWSTAAKAYVYTSGIYVGTVRAICS